MMDTLTYCIFPTKWGYFGLAARQERLVRTCLPLQDAGAVEHVLLGHQPGVHCKDLNRDLQQVVRRYFEGSDSISSLEIPLWLPGAGPFVRAVYRATQAIPCGGTAHYGHLAAAAGSPGAARAVGRIMAGNPFPLIVPCHRVLRKDGQLGGFSAMGGVAVKQRLLDHESGIRVNPDVRLAVPATS